MPAVITLTTDFGLSDAFVAAMKGVIFGITTDARIVDITHLVEPQNISQASYILSTIYDFFPPRTIHVAVVDPGVGTERRAVVLRTPQADFVAPDNGILSSILKRYSPSPVSRRQVGVPAGLQAVSINNPRVLAGASKQHLSWPGYFRACRGPPIAGSPAVGIWL